MTIKMVECYICGKQVTKRNTNFVEGKGRACKEHEEVINNVQAQREKERLSLENSIKKVQNKYKHNTPTFDFKLRCWKCEKEGINHLEFLEKTLAAYNAEKILGLSPNLIKPNYLSKYLTEVERNPLYILDNKIPEVHKVRINSKFVEPMLFGNIKVLCHACIKNENLFSIVFPKLTFDSIGTIFNMLLEDELKEFIPKIEGK